MEALIGDARRFFLIDKVSINWRISRYCVWCLNPDNPDSLKVLEVAEDATNALVNHKNTLESVQGRKNFIKNDESSI